MSKSKISKVTVALIAFCTIIWLYVYLSLSERGLGSGDEGQWIMLARFYRGEVVPSYVSPTAYAPVFPMLLALAITILNDAVLAVHVLGATTFVLLSVSFFVVGKELWDTTAGMFALLIGSLGQYFFLYATSWGGYPQLLFLAWVNFAVSRFIIIYRDGNISPKHSICLGLFLWLSLFTHFPSVIILIAIFGVPGIHFLFKIKNIAVKEKVNVLLPVAMPLIAWIVYIAFYFKETLGYVGNEAALYLRGINTVWFYLVRQPESTAFLFASISAIVIGLAWASRRKTNSRVFGLYFAAIWTFSTVTLMGFLYIVAVKTEYTRFTYLIVPPLVLNLTGALSTFTNINIDTVNTKKLKTHTISIKKWIFPIILIVALLPFPAIHEFYWKAIQYYSMKNSNDFRGVLEWIEKGILFNESVLTATQKEGRWLEGLTGRPALFFLPEIASYRPWMHERSIAADTLLTSSIAIENGYMLVKFNGNYNSLPIQPSVSVCREGKYIDALWLRDKLTKIKLITPWGEVQNLSLSDFNRFSHEVLEEPEAIRIISKLEKDITQTVLYLNKTITVTKNSPTVSVHYEIQTVDSFYIKDFSLGILDPLGQNRKDTKIDKELWIIYSTATEREMVVRILWNKPDVVIYSQPLSNEDPRIVTWLTFLPNATSTAKLNIQIITAPTGRLIEDLCLYKSSELLEKYNVKAALLSKDGNLWYQIINLQNLGLTKVFENDSYVILERLQHG